MTLDEAIQHCHEVAKENRKTALEYARAYAWDTAHGCRECANEHEKLASWLTELKECRGRARWIPCSERMPEENVYVIAWAKRKHHSRAIMAILINGIWKIGVNDCSGGFHAQGEITHWMPMPEPPEVNGNV